MRKGTEDRGRTRREYEVEPTKPADQSWWDRFNAGFNRHVQQLLDFYEHWVRRALERPGLTVAVLTGLFLASLAIYPFLGLSFFPRTDAGQFTINLKVPTGTRIEVTNEYVAKVENLIRKVVDPKDYKLVVSNIGVVPDFSSLYTTNAGPYTATVQVQLQDEHRRSSFDYMQEVQEEISKQYPEIRTFFSSGSMVDAILNMGMPAPIDVQVSSQRSGAKLRDRAGLGAADPEPAGGGRGLHSTGHELSGVCGWTSTACMPGNWG